MNILALIPARGGSKRLPGKNLRELGGKPLIGWTIEQALESHCFGSVLVSTDSEQIAEVSRAHGAQVPWLRPSQLSDDTASSVDVVLHALDAYANAGGSFDAVCLLQPTSPFRSRGKIGEAVCRFYESDGQSPVVSVSPVVHKPWWMFTVLDGELEPVAGWAHLTTRSQDLPPVWGLNGSFYLARADYIREHRSFLGPGALAVQMSHPAESLDIDTLEDFDACVQALSVSDAWPLLDHRAG